MIIYEYINIEYMIECIKYKLIRRINFYCVLFTEVLIVEMIITNNYYN